VPHQIEESDTLIRHRCRFLLPINNLQRAAGEVAIEFGSITLFFLHHGQSGFDGHTGLFFSTGNFIANGRH